MRSAPPTPPPRPAFRWSDLATVVDIAWKFAVLLLLAWIGWNVQLLRKAERTQTAVPAVTTTTAEEEPTGTVAPVYEPDLSAARLRRVANALKARPPRGIQVTDAVLNNVTAGELAHIAVEIFIRRNRCFTPTATEAINGNFSPAEQRALRTCASLTSAGLMKDRTEPDVPRAIDWLERLVAP